MRPIVATSAFLAGAAFAAAAFWAGHEIRGDAELGIVPTATDARSAAQLVARIEDLEARFDALARTSSPAAVRNDEAARGAGGAPSAAGAPAPSATGAVAADGIAAPGARLGEFEELRRLRDAPDDKTRLELARELLKQDNPIAAISALRVLADLAPEEALAAVDAWVAAVAGGASNGWQVERAVATLVDGKGAALLGTDLDSKLRDWYQRGDDDLRRTTARNLEQRGDSGPMEQLVAGYRGDLGNSDVGRRMRAVESLGRTRSTQAVPALLPMLADSSDEVRLGALDALRRTGNEAVIEKVRPLLDDPVAAVRDRATRTIESLRRGEREPDFRGGDFRGGNFRGGFPFDGGRRGSN